jgi:SAM-dependent methyltransferase
MTGLPPGTILQYLYIRERLKKRRSGQRFLDIGSGNGMLSSLLLNMGFQGLAVDLNQGACENNRKANQSYIDKGKFNVVHGNLLELADTEKFDVILACMVIEHLRDADLKSFIEACKNLLKPDGNIVFLVPASMKYWGIEDEIAGHILRYEEKDVKELAQKFNLKLEHHAGLTYPVSNILFRLSNKIIQKNEGDKLKLSEQERTVYTGNRDVTFKTTFPAVFNVILNPIVMYPLHMLQKLFRRHPQCMVMYVELSKN